MKTFVKIIALLLVCAALCPLVASCKDEEPQENPLNGKRIIFIGDSFVFYGQVVLEKTQTVLSQAKRYNDHGYFYQLCKAMGAEVEVTNFTFGGHGLANFLQESCTVDRDCKGMDHISHLKKDLDYDYVVISGGRSSSQTTEGFLGNMDALINMFLEVNPDTKFFYLVSSGAHNVSVNPTLPHNVLNSLDTLEDTRGVTIVDWGKMVSDIIDGKNTVPGATQTYNKNSFVVNWGEKDGYHPNQLAGYLTSAMLYSAMTGTSAVGLPYAFWNDTTLRKDNDKKVFFNSAEYIKKYYTHGTTNYDKIFASEADMKGLQQLIDQYLAAKAYRNYNFAPLE